MTASARRDALPATAALLCNAAVWGLSWWPLRRLQDDGVHPLWATAIIYLVSVAALLVLRPRAWRGYAAHRQLWLLTAASGLTNVCFNWSVATGDVVRVVLLFYLMPLWTVLLAWPLLGERPRPASLARMLLALAGVVVILKAPDSPWPVPESVADWLALGGGFSFALTNIMLRKLGHAPSDSRALAMFGGGALIGLGAALLASSQGIAALPPAPAASWLPYAAALSVAFLGANLALQYGAARLSAHGTALVMLSEVVFASASSVALGAAALNERIWIGGALILLAALWSALTADSPPALRSEQVS
ncbi:MAG: Putative transmembrane protein [Burkholderiaceae bacterium]|jgi:drug/metabolite transporter (DMT)-like permease|nr:MAG: Putative transmembrane protein [Burkholderiaceae bacterium]